MKNTPGAGRLTFGFGSCVSVRNIEIPSKLSVLSPLLDPVPHQPIPAATQQTKEKFAVHFQLPDSTKFDGILFVYFP